MWRLLTFFQTLQRVIALQWEPWVIPFIRLQDLIEIYYDSPRPTSAASSGRIGQLLSSVPWTPDRNVPKRFLKCPRDFA